MQTHGNMLPAPGPIGVESVRPPVFPVAGVQPERALTAREQRMRRLRQKRRQRDDFDLLGPLDEADASASADATSDENKWEDMIQRSLDKIIDASRDYQAEFPDMEGQPALVKGRFFQEGAEPVILSSTKYIPSFVTIKENDAWSKREWKTEDGILHRNYGPAKVVQKDNKQDEYWFYKNVPHRWGGPAVVMENGEKHYFVRAQRGDRKVFIRHRLDGPAIYDNPGEEDMFFVGDRNVSEKDYPDAAAEWIYMFGRK